MTFGKYTISQWGQIVDSKDPNVYKRFVAYMVTKDWFTAKQDPYWVIRRAAILADVTNSAYLSVDEHIYFDEHPVIRSMRIPGKSEHISDDHKREIDAFYEGLELYLEEHSNA